MFLVGLSASFMPFLMVVLVALVWVGNAADLNLVDNHDVVKTIEVTHQADYNQTSENTISYHEAQQQVDAVALSSKQPSLFQYVDICEQWGVHHFVFIATYSGVSHSLRAPPVC